MVFFLALARTLLIGIYRRVIVLGHEYVPIGIFALIALSFPILTFFAGRFFRPNNENALKNSTYECGEVPVGEAHIQFHFQYYRYAIIFLVFDIAFMFLSFAGILVTEATAQGGSEVVSLEEVWGGLVSLIAIFGFMVLGVWYVFRKRGRIYI